jgi:hypothetical protein
VAILAVLVKQKQRNNSGRFAVVPVFDRAKIQDFCGGRGIARCKISGKNSENSKTASRAVALGQARAGQMGSL